MALTPVYGGIDDDRALQVLHHAVDIGVSFIDTADVYGAPAPGTTGPAGTNEELLSRLLRDRRGEVTLATKFGITGAIGLSSDPAVAGAGKRTRGDRGYARRCLEDSLRRLGTDVIDLWYLHRPDPEVQVEETVGFMAEQVAAGKVRHIGLSEVTAAELRRAHRVHPIAAVQSEWSLWSRDVEDNVVPACAELGVGFVPYSPLGRGLLTGTLTREQITGDARAGMERINAGWSANQRALAVVSGVADRIGATNAQVCLAWLIDARRRHGLTVVPIPGTRSTPRLEENARAVDVLLDDRSLAELDGVAALVSGSRNIIDDPTWISAGRE
ncbi:aldo/keto reductase [Corynebacterium pacaense]|uniref:aldo/keto reductase n=1 Tax=Corynebacterium pacaense TaxID=1816684 RepID=UPI001FE65B19|nr:aldo/keto reductase [Corynebacterium pacaense]